jgi:hypothetical protein
MNYVLLVPIAYVLLACICRLNMMTPETSRVLWRLAYILLAAWTGWVGADLMETGDVHLRDAMGMLALALYVHLTRARWVSGVPEIAQPNVSFLTLPKE